MGLLAANLKVSRPSLPLICLPPKTSLVPTEKTRSPPWPALLGSSVYPLPHHCRNGGSEGSDTRVHCTRVHQLRKVQSLHCGLKSFHLGWAEAAVPDSWPLPPGDLQVPQGLPDAAADPLCRQRVLGCPVLQLGPVPRPRALRAPRPQLQYLSAPQCQQLPPSA